MTAQPEKLEFLRDLPICTGLGVCRDVLGIKDFFTAISGENVELNGFIDISSMSTTVGIIYKLNI